MRCRLVVFMSICVLFSPTLSRAAGIGMGFTTWYSWWTPYWANHKPGYQLPIMPLSSYYQPDNSFKINIRPNCMYGPVVSLFITDSFDIQSRFLYGHYTAQKKEQGVLNYLLKDHISLIKRYDTDVLFRYRLHQMVSVNAGFAYSHIAHEILGLSVNYFGYFAAGRVSTRNRFNEYVPFAGLGVSIPVIRNTLAINIDANFIYCFASEQRRKFLLGRTEFTSDITVIPPYTTVQKIKKLGVDAKCDLAYRVPRIPMDISAGFRYRMYKRLIVERKKELEYEHQYGVTAGVAYRFDFRRPISKETVPEEAG